MRRWVARRTGHGRTAVRGFSKWPEFRHLPRVRLYPSQESGVKTAWKLLNHLEPCLLPPEHAEQLLLEVNNAMPTVFFFLLLFSSHPQSFDLGRCFLVNTKSSTPVARSFSCLPTLTNPASTDTQSHHGQRKLQLSNKQLWPYQSGCFSLVFFFKKHTITKKAHNTRNSKWFKNYFGHLVLKEMFQAPIVLRVRKRQKPLEDKVSRPAKVKFEDVRLYLVERKMGNSRRSFLTQLARSKGFIVEDVLRFEKSFPFYC